MTAGQANIMHFVRIDEIPADQAGGKGGSMPTNDMDIGALKQAVQDLTERLKEYIRAHDELRAEIFEMKLLIAQIKGGSKVIIWAGSLVSGGIGAALMKIIPVLFVKG